MRSVFSAGLLLVFLLVSYERNSAWQNDGTIWSDAIDKAPMKSRGYNELGLHAIHVRDYSLAISAFTRALQLDPYLYNAYINIGIAYEGLKQTDRAVLAYEKAIYIIPNDPTAYYNLGLLCYKILHDRDRALELFLKARDLNPLEPDVHQNLGLIYQAMGNYERAQEEFRMYSQLK